MNRVFIVLICLFTFTSIAQAQNSKLDGPFITKRVIKVYGDCEQCKSAIEKTAKRIPGVTFAHWDADSRQLLVEYNRTKTNPEKIQQVIAAGGHDTDKFRATDKTYAETRTGCCCHGGGGK
jgi:copper chaperone CopZ